MTDGKGQGEHPQMAIGITATQPANVSPAALVTIACAAHVCTFDGRSIVDENIPGIDVRVKLRGRNDRQRGGTRTYLRWRLDVHGKPDRDRPVAGGHSTTMPVTIMVLSGNVAPTPVIVTSWPALACSASHFGTVNPIVGDLLSYTWSWGDSSPVSTRSAPTRVALRCGLSVRADDPGVGDRSGRPRGRRRHARPSPRNQAAGSRASCGVRSGRLRRGHRAVHTRQASGARGATLGVDAPPGT